MTTLNSLIEKLGKPVAFDLIKRKTDCFAQNTEGGKITAISLSKNSTLSELVLGKEADALVYLSLSGLTSLTKVVFEGRLPALTHLYLDNCALTELIIPKGCCTALEQLYVQKNKLTMLVFEGDCQDLEFLDVSGNQLTQFNLPTGFSNLAYLYAANNATLEKLNLPTLPVLDTLNLSNNKLSELPVAWLKNNPQLTTLYLADNPLPDDINGFVQNVGYGSSNCLVAVQQYFRDLEKGDALDNEYKTLLIGNGNVGKSCLVHRLMHDEFNEDWDSTHGIALEQYQHENYIFNLWDFGGQDIYHATHRLFMKSNALYLTLWDTKTAAEPFTERLESGELRRYDNYGLSYWLDYAKSQGENSPIIVIQTKATPDTKTDLPIIRAQYTKQFPVLEFKHIDSALNDWDDNGYNELLIAMRKAVKGFKRQKKTPKNRAEVRQALREKQKEGKKEMSLTDYLELAKGVEDPMGVLENWLVKTGVVFYQKGLFGEAIILDQAWTIKAIYAIFRRTSEDGDDNGLYYKIQRQHGVFTGADLKKIWKKNSESEQKLFISFMLSCDLCFETTQQVVPDLKEGDIKSLPIEKRHFVAPQLLPQLKPKGVEDTWLNRKSWYLRYQHDFLHYGIIQSFIVKTQTFAEMRDIWKMGISLREGDNLALVECQDKAITVRITEGGKTLLDKIRNLLDKLQDNKGIETGSLDGENYVVLTELKGNTDEKIKALSKNWVVVKDFQFFLNREEKNTFEQDKNQDIHQKTVDMTINELQNQVREFIAKAKTDKAIALINSWATDNRVSSLQDAIVVINSDWQTLYQDGILGVAENETKRRNSLNIQILRLVSGLTSDVFIEPEPLKPIVPKQPEPQIASEPTKPAIATLKLLFFGANPFNTGKLNLKGEYAEIARRLEKDNAKDKLLLQSEFSTTLEDFQEKTDKFRPNIIHFAGHGADEGNEMSDFSRAIGLINWRSDGGLVFFDSEHRQAEYISADTLDYNFETFIDIDKIPIHIVIFNACYSVKQAEVISKRVKYVVGVNNSIADGASIDFTAGFYYKLAEKNDVIAAFRYGKGRALNKLKDRNHIVLFIDGAVTKY